MSELFRLRDAVFQELLDAANEAMELIDGYQDVVDGDYGVPAPNKAMKAYTLLKDAIEKVERNSHERPSDYT